MQFISLVHTTCQFGGIYVLLALIYLFYLKDFLEINYLRICRTDLYHILLNCRKMIVHDWAYSFSIRSRDAAMVANFRVKIYKLVIANLRSSHWLPERDWKIATSHISETILPMTSSKFGECCIWPAPSLAALWYVIYFRFCKCSHNFTEGLLSNLSNNASSIT